MSPSKLVVYTQTSNSHPLYYLLLPHLMRTYVCVVQFGKAGHCAAKLYVPQDQEASNTPFFLLPHTRRAMQNIKSKLLKVSHNELVLSSHTFHQIFEQECNSRNIYCVSQLPGSVLGALTYLHDFIFTTILWTTSCYSHSLDKEIKVQKS